MLSIGEFSKMCMVTTKTLRHYDLIGLLKPKELNNDNGYRYYSVKQLEIMQKIQRLKYYGFSLEEIKLLINIGDSELVNVMTDKLLDMQVFIENEKLKIHRLKKDIENIRRGDFMKQQFEISLIETAPVNIVSLRETIAIKDFSILMKKSF